MKKIKEKIIGAWCLVSFEQQSQDGEVTYPLGKTAKGALYYLPDGHVSVHIMQEDRKGSIGYLAYCGRYHIDEEKQIMTHSVEISLDESWVGSQQVRLMQWPDGNLLLSPPNLVGTNKVQVRLLWRRP